MLLIPLVAVSFGLTYVWGKITDGFVGFIGSDTARDLARPLGLNPDAFPVGLPAIAHGVNIAQLVTLSGIGFGAVLRNVTLAVVLLLVWFLIIENVLVIATWNLTSVLGGIAADAFGISTLNLPGGVDRWSQLGLQLAAGAPGVFSWWASALVFFGWTMVFFAFGRAGNQRRDIT